MTKPVLASFNTLAPLFVQAYERYLPSAFDDSLTMLQKVNKIIEYMAEIGIIANDLISQWNIVNEWVMEEGLTEAVALKIMDLLNNGDLDSMLNREYIAVLNERTDTLGATDFANFGGQGLPRESAPIGFIFHHYTDGEMMRLDNVGDSTILTLKNATNSLRRNDKPSTYVGAGTFLECREQGVSTTNLLFSVANDGNLKWFNKNESAVVGDGSGEVKLYNLKTPTTSEYAFRLIPYYDATKLLDIKSANNKSAFLFSVDSGNYSNITTTSSNAGLKITPTGNYWVKPTTGDILLEGNTFVRKNSVNYKAQTVYAGTTANRPTDFSVGESYFDTTLGKPIWLKTAPSVWVDAVGSTV